MASRSPRRSTARACSLTITRWRWARWGSCATTYANFGFDRADLIVAVGYELQEFDPVRINPRGDTKIIHLHRFPAEVDAHYDVAVGLHSEIGHSLDALADAAGPRTAAPPGQERIRALLAGELARGQGDERFPLAPARIVADTRAGFPRSSADRGPG